MKLTIAFLGAAAAVLAPAALPSPAKAWGQGGRTVTVDPPYLDRAKPIVETRLRRAGIRLADALDRSFDPAFEGWGS
jgi:hypothetical protein